MWVVENLRKLRSALRRNEASSMPLRPRRPARGNAMECYVRLTLSARPPKTVVLERHGDAARFHPLLLELSGAYCASLRLCAPRKGNQKGKVERAIRYLRERFLAGREVRSIEQGNRELLAFLAEV